MMYIYIDEDYEVVYQLTSHDSPNWDHWEIEVYAISLAGTSSFSEEPAQ